MWLVNLNLPLYQFAELRQIVIHPLVEFGCVIILLHLLVVCRHRHIFGSPLRLVGKSGAI